MNAIAQYRPVVAALAEQALTMAIDGSPTRPAAGETVVSMLALKALSLAKLRSGGETGGKAGGETSGDDGGQAAASIAALVTALADPKAKIVDGLGHHRPVYRAFAWQVLKQAGVAVAEPLSIASCGYHGQCWDAWQQALCGENATWPGQNAQAATSAPGVTSGGDATSGGRGLHGQTLDDAPEDWTYRELVAMHALNGWLAFNPLGASAAVLAERRAWLHEACVFHLHHTQPDYTTYQPWGLAAFLASTETAHFAEQQLHDVQTHLHLGGPASALVPGLLLVDALGQMDAMSRS